MKDKIWMILVLSVLLVACSSQAPAGTAILSPAEMPGGVQGPTVKDNGGISVTIVFTTGVPTICNVAYGPDTSYGTLDQMPMMEGAVREHTITLTGLTPETTYHYRLSMTDERARLYQSADLTFTTTAGTDSESGEQPKKENVASLEAGAKVIAVSSNYGDKGSDSSFGANKAVDGQPNTEWSSNGDGDDAWIEIELAQTYDVHTIGFWTRTMSDNTAQIFRFTVTTGEGKVFGPFDLPDADRVYTFPVQFTARTLRFDAVETNTGNTGAVEIEVYGTPHKP